jgi:hypothetical protein
MYIFTVRCREFHRSPPAPPPPPYPLVSGTVPAGQCSPLTTSGRLIFMFSEQLARSTTSHTDHVLHACSGGGASPPHPPLYIQCQGQRSLVCRCVGRSGSFIFQLVIISFYCLYSHEFIRRLDWTMLLMGETDRQTVRIDRQGQTWGLVFSQWWDRAG